MTAINQGLSSESLGTAREGLTLGEKVREFLLEHPLAMTMQVARQLNVPEAEVIRNLPEGRGVELDGKRWEEILHRLEEFGSVHVIVSNGAATMECQGEFGNFSTWGEFFNVQTKSLDMHIRYPQLGSIFAVEKPSHMSGIHTLSVQFFDLAGNSAFKVFLTFGNKAPSESMQGKFEELRATYRLKEDLNQQ